MAWFTIGLLLVLVGYQWHTLTQLYAVIERYQRYEVFVEREMADMQRTIEAFPDKTEHEQQMAKEIVKLKMRISDRNRRIMDIDPTFNPEEDA